MVFCRSGVAEEEPLELEVLDGEGVDVGSDMARTNPLACCADIDTDSVLGVIWMVDG